MSPHLGRRALAVLLVPQGDEHLAPGDLIVLFGDQDAVRKIEVILA